MNRRSIWFLFMAGALVIPAACSGGDSNSAKPCAAGEVVDCACPDGTTSTQECTGDGAYTACSCATDATGAGAMPASGGAASGSGGAIGGTGGGMLNGSGGTTAGTGGAPSGTGGAMTGGATGTMAGGAAGTMAGGAGGAGGDATSDAGTPGDPLDEARQACVDKINALRAMEGLPPYSRWVDGESCGDGEAQLDSESGIAHDSFGTCNESAQNSCLRVRSLDITRCLDSMYGEGPPPSEPCNGQCFQDHGHYINITSTRYTKVACSFYPIPGTNQYWALQNFSR